mgnify:CR=1 FL=1
MKYEVNEVKHQTEMELITYGGYLQSMYVLSTDEDYAMDCKVEHKTNQDIVRTESVVNP